MSKSATIYTYPWDSSDADSGQVLETIADTAGLKRLDMTPSYHVSISRRRACGLPNDSARY